MTRAAAARTNGGLPAHDGPGPEEIVALVAEHGAERGGLIAMLGEVQAECGYLPEQTLRAIADQTGRSLVDVYGVATFYRSFSLTPRGEHVISACLGTACHVRGAANVVKEFERQLGIEAGQTTADREFTLETVRCLGACALGPIAVVDGHYFSKVKPPEVSGILERAREGLHKVEVGTDERVFPIQANCPRCNHSLMDPARLIDDLPSIRVTASWSGVHCELRLSCLYGSDITACGSEIPVGSVVGVFCPHCFAEMVGASICPACSAPMALMMVREGGILQVCTRRGCKEHRLDLTGVNA